MSKFYGSIGFATTEETKPGVWVEKIIEKNYYGDVIKDTQSNQNSGNVNDNITISKRISIVSDLFANKHYSNIIYAELKGIRWKVTSIDIEYPRLVLSVGGVYNG